jgi:hypothetical protein
MISHQQTVRMIRVGFRRQNPVPSPQAAASGHLRQHRIEYLFEMLVDRLFAPAESTPDFASLHPETIGVEPYFDCSASGLMM